MSRRTTHRRARLQKRRSRDRSKDQSHAYHVYVIETTHHGRVAMYVGQSGKTPEARLRDQAASCKTYCASCRCRHYVPGRGQRMRLRYDLFSAYGPMATRQEAERAERRLAARLKRQGYHVIGGH